MSFLNVLNVAIYCNVHAVANTYALFIMSLLNTLNVANYCNVNAVASTMSFIQVVLSFNILVSFPIVYLIILRDCVYSIFNLVVGVYNIRFEFSYPFL